MDPRIKARKRTVQMVVKLHPEELARLVAIAEANCRTPAEQMRFWLTTHPAPSDPLRSPMDET